MASAPIRSQLSCQAQDIKHSSFLGPLKTADANSNTKNKQQGERGSAPKSTQTQYQGNANIPSRTE
eukprot:4971786-Amphidinium_carterae.1